MSTKKSIKINGCNAVVAASWDVKPVGRRTRLYTTVELEQPAPAWKPRGEDPTVDKAWDAYNRAEVKAMRVKVLNWLDAAGYERVKVRFSRKAGCGCGCSPGFIADRQLRPGLGYGEVITDVFV